MFIAVLLFSYLPLESLNFDRSKMTVKAKGDQEKWFPYVDSRSEERDSNPPIYHFLTRSNMHHIECPAIKAMFVPEILVGTAILYSESGIL